MKKGIWILIIILVLAGIAWYLIKDKDADYGASNYTNQNNTAPTLTFGQDSYQAIVKAKAANNGLDTETTLNYDASTGYAQIFINTGTGTSELIYGNGASYFRQGNSDSWLSGASAANQYSGFAYTPDQISQSVNYLTMATNEGQQACGSSICNVWSYDEGLKTSRIFLEKGTDKLKRLEYVENGTTATEIDFTYGGSYDIEIPTNVIDTSSPEALSDPATLEALQQLGQ